MDVWVPGLLSLLGALVGVVLANYLGSRTQRQRERQQRLEEAIRAVAVARATAQFSYNAHVEGVPTSVTADDRDEMSRRLWLGSVERYFERLHEAREAVAALGIDGIDLQHYCQSDAAMQAGLEPLWHELVAQKSRRRGTLQP